MYDRNGKSKRISTQLRAFIPERTSCERNTKFH